jgi:hypothetical protein
MNYFYTPRGRIILAVIILVALGVAGYELIGFFGASTTAQDFNRRWMVCTETGKAYQVDLATISVLPAHSPFSGKDTGQPAELCYWTADGQPKKEPTPVLLNKYRGLPEPTFCPDCGRLVVERNPGAEPGSRPPPTRAEQETYQQR